MKRNKLRVWHCCARRNKKCLLGINRQYFVFSIFQRFMTLLLLWRSEIKQKNEGGWEFYWDEESRPGFVILEVKVARFLDSSLIDVDVHPGYVSMIIKSKVRFRSIITPALSHFSHTRKS